MYSSALRACIVGGTRGPIYDDILEFSAVGSILLAGSIILAGDFNAIGRSLFLICQEICSENWI